MNLCSCDHDEICYENSKCPLCELRSEWEKEYDKLRSENNDLEEDNKILEKENTELINRLKEAKEGLLLLKGKE